MIKLKEQGFAALKALLLRRHVILCVAGVLAVGLLLWQLLPLIPRTAKPQQYRVGETAVQALTEIVGYRKVTAVTQALSGVGRAQAGMYSYKAGKAPQEDMVQYGAWLCAQQGGTLLEQEGDAQSGRLLVSLPAQDAEHHITVELAYNSKSYTITVDEQRRPKQKVEPQHPVNVTPAQAAELVMSLTKAETGFKADISVYTTTMEEEKANVEGWEYYVFTTIADYSATRVEYRGTFYVGCSDGIILRYDKDTDATSRLRAGATAE